MKFENASPSSFRIGLENKLKLEKICKDEKITISDFINRLIENYKQTKINSISKESVNIPVEEIEDTEFRGMADAYVEEMLEPPPPTPELSIPEPEPEPEPPPVIPPPPVPVPSPVYTTPPEIKVLELDVTGMSPIDIVKYSLVAIHRVNLEISPVKMQELQYIKYLRYGYEDYCMVKDRDNYSGSAPLRFNVDIFHTFKVVWGDATHAHNINIRPMMFMFRQYVEACKKIKNFKLEMFDKIDKYDKAFGAEFDKVDNPVTRFFKNRENIFIPSMTRDGMLEIFLDEDKYKKYYMKFADGVYE